MAAAKCGISPNVIHHDKGILVLDFIESKTLTDVDIKKKIINIIPIIKKIHKEIPKNIYGESLIFWVFHVINNYAKFLKDNNSSYIKILDTLIKRSQQIEKIASPYEIVFGHNDLLPANFLDDGSRIWIIDWEYAGYNSPLFDLGGLASNNNFEIKDEIFLLENYFDKKINDNLLLRYNSMKGASQLRETMWSMVSEITSKIDFDYHQYTQVNLAKFNKIFDSLQG
jgi:thiamine kinase-like enzyme